MLSYFSKLPYVLLITTTKMLSSTLSQDFNLTDFSASSWAWLSPVDPFVSVFHFRIILIQFFCFYKWSPGYPTLARRIQKGLNESFLLLCNLEFPALPYVVPITAVNASYQNINCITNTVSSNALVVRWFVMLKSIWGATGLCGGKHCDFVQSFYAAL